mmetsp:Transcript_5025/g.13022  ORF Transcript_5025/g.13022 Transcript_5025/m.13022 type:complete len:82 (-) Transcript_5025:139-384(-)
MAEAARKHDGVALATCTAAELTEPAGPAPMRRRAGRGALPRAQAALLARTRLQGVREHLRAVLSPPQWRTAWQLTRQSVER